MIFSTFCGSGSFSCDVRLPSGGLSQTRGPLRQYVLQYVFRGFCVAEHLWVVDLPRQQVGGGIDDFPRVGVGYHPGVGPHYLHPLRLRAHDDTRLLEEIRLFLHAAAVGDDNGRVLLQDDDVEERRRRDTDYVTATPELFVHARVEVEREQFRRPRVQRQHELVVRHPPRDLHQGPEDRREPLRVVGVVVAVYGHKDIFAGVQVMALQYVGFLLGDAGEIHAVVVHHVAEVDDGVRPAVGEASLRVEEALSSEVLDGRVGRGEEYCREPVADDAVHLLGHRHVERAQAGLDVVHRHVEFAGGHGAGERRVGVAVEYHAVEMLRQQHILDAGDHLGGLLAVPPRPHVQVVIRVRDAELVEEHLRHVGVVVLPRVQYPLLDGPGETVSYRA